MASKQTLQVIARSAAFLASPTAARVADYLHPALQLALQAIAPLKGGKALTYEELGKAAKLNHYTIRKVVKALQDGGYPIAVERSDRPFNPAHGNRPLLVKLVKRKR